MVLLCCWSPSVVKLVAHPAASSPHTTSATSGPWLCLQPPPPPPQDLVGVTTDHMRELAVRVYKELHGQYLAELERGLRVEERSTRLTDSIASLEAAKASLTEHLGQVERMAGAAAAGDPTDVALEAPTAVERQCVTVATRHCLPASPALPLLTSYRAVMCRAVLWLRQDVHVGGQGAGSGRHHIHAGPSIGERGHLAARLCEECAAPSSGPVRSTGSGAQDLPAAASPQSALGWAQVTAVQ